MWYSVKQLFYAVGNNSSEHVRLVLAPATEQWATGTTSLGVADVKLKCSPVGHVHVHHGELESIVFLPPLSACSCLPFLFATTSPMLKHGLLLSFAEPNTRQYGSVHRGSLFCAIWCERCGHVPSCNVHLSFEGSCPIGEVGSSIPLCRACLLDGVRKYHIPGRYFCSSHVALKRANSSVRATQLHQVLRRLSIKFYSDSVAGMHRATSSAVLIAQ